jgi:hypothetical protein
MASRRSPDASRPVTTAPAAGVRKKIKLPRKSAAPATPPHVGEAARRKLIAVGAYLRAERRGFAPGDPTEDWLAAEAEVDALLKVSPGSSQ